MRTRILPLLLVFALLGGCAVAPAPNPAEDGTLYSTMREASASVLKDGRIAGSGAFVDGEGSFLTAAHVVHNARHRIELLLPGGRVYPAVVVARDLGADIVLLQMVEPAASPDASDAPAAADRPGSSGHSGAWANPDAENAGDTDTPGDHPNNTSSDGDAHAPKPMPTPGGWLALSPLPPPAGAAVYVYGAPAMYRDLMLPGRIAADSPRYNHQGANDCYLHSVNLAGPTPPGISGGCWVNLSGHVVGVQCSHIGSDSATTGMAFIAPLADIRRLVNTRRDQPAATLGVQVVSLWSQSYAFNHQFPHGSAGVAVHRVLEDGPAHRVDLPRDILITHVDGQPTPDVNAFMDIIRARTIGEPVTLRTIAPNSHTVETYAVQVGELKW